MAVCVVFFLAVALAAAAGGEAALVEHTFVVSQMKVHHLCKDTLVPVVNGQLPGPAIEVTEGDSVVVHVINKLPHPVTIHWHGVNQRMNCWADGAAMITQCPIQPSNNFTYRFDVVAQEGTLWWHAHVGRLRATVHGALVIRPRLGPDSYPFPKPDEEIPILIGEWWDVDLVQLENNIARNEYNDNARSATLNGKLGDINNCSGVIEDSYNLNVEHGKTYLLRIVNVGLHSEYYFKIAGHIFIVVAADANYVKPYTTDIIVIAPGETVDALVVADAPPGATSFYFHGNLTSLPHQFLRSVPTTIDERLVMTTDMGYICKEGGSACGALVARMNNISFQLPTETSLLQAHYYNNMSNTRSILQEFPSKPPKIVFNKGTTVKATSLRRVRYNTTLEIVFQGPPEVFSFPNPMHLHGQDFFILAQGHDKYDAVKHVQTYNLVDPPVRNMALVPRFGWTVIRFVASNPGVWILHCHIEQHVSSGMAMAFVVDDGPTLDTALPPPPENYPICHGQSSKVAYE